MTEDGCLGLVNDTEHSDNILILRLGNELGENTNVIKRPLRVGVTHRSIQHIDCTELSRMIPTVLTARERVEIKVDADTIFASPLDSLQEVSGKSRDINSQGVR